MTSKLTIKVHHRDEPAQSAQVKVLVSFVNCTSLISVSARLMEIRHERWEQEMVVVYVGSSSVPYLPSYLLVPTLPSPRSSSAVGRSIVMYLVRDLNQ